MNTNNELFDVLTESGKHTGLTKRRSDIHRDGDWHASVHIWIARKQPSGMEYLMQKRADNKDSFPGCWDAATTGHVDAGEDAITAALRELHEELGVNADPSKLTLLFRTKSSTDNIFHGKRFINNELKWIFLYTGALDSEINFERDEISGVAWQNADAIETALGEDKPPYCMGLQEYREVRRCTNN